MALTERLDRETKDAGPSTAPRNHPADPAYPQRRQECDDGDACPHRQLGANVDTGLPESLGGIADEADDLTRIIHEGGRRIRRAVGVAQALGRT